MSRLLFGALLVTGCGGNQKSDLQVMSYTPSGSVEKTEPVEIKFDKPVVDEAMVGKPADPAAVAITPAVAWKGFWQDRQTLAIEPQGELAPSTRYQVALTGELAKRTHNFHFDFVHRPLAVEGVWGADPMSLAPDGEVPVSFNQPVNAADAAAKCKLSADGKDLKLTATATEPTASVSLKTEKPLEPGKDYTLSCAGIAGAGGNAVMETPYSLALHVRPMLGIASITPTGGDVGADEVAITVSFTTPVSLEAARKAVSSKPRIRGLDQGYLSGDGLEYKVTADLEVTTDYAVTVKDLEDTFGQKLAKPVTQAFKTGDAQPRLSMERGIFALEASAKGYPLWSRNVDAFQLECGQIPRDKLVQVLTTDMNYDPWGGNDDDKPIDWKKLKTAAKKHTIKTAGKNKWLLHELDLGAQCSTPGTRGVYLAEVSSSEVQPDPNRGWWQPRRNRVLANVTDMGVMIKAGTSSGLVWVTSLSSGQPIGGAKVTVYNSNGKQVYTDTSNADGIVKVPGSALLKAQNKTTSTTDTEAAEDWDNYRSQRLIAVVEKADDVAVVDGNWANGIQIWNFGVPEDRTGGVTKVRGFIQSDRGLYRPGESVHFKGIAREVTQGMPPSVPKNGKVEVEVTDSRGQAVLSKNTKLSTFGGFAFDMDLGADAVLGDYYVNATVAGQVFREKFSVEEFRPASFELKLASAQKAPRPGERLTFDLNASYLFGSPVADAKVEWSLRRRKHVVRFDGFDEYTFSANPFEWWWWDDSSDDYGDFISDGDGATNAQGKLHIAVRDSATTFDGPVDYILSTNVTDSSDQTMGKSSVVTAHKTSLYLGLHANEFVQAVGMPFGVNVVALSPEGQRAATKAKLTFTRTARSCEWDDMGSRSFQRCTSTDKVELERDVDIAESGSHTERIVPQDPGEYVVRIEATDSRGNKVSAASEIYVIGKGDAFWSGDEGDRMTVIASKPTYKVGETARLIAQANLVQPTALITIERDGIIDAQVKKLASPSEGIELPIQDAWAPNVFASIALVSGRHGVGDRNRPQFKMGVVELKVATEHKQLDVAVSLENPTVRPGDDVAGTIKVTHDGKPVSAEVSLSAADEGVLQLIAYQTPNPMKTFYASYGLGVDSGTNWNRIARLADPQAGDPDEGGDSAAAADGQRVRSKFVSSAYWAPMLLTDSQGEIHFSFKAPDNLTAFRLMAVAADMSDKFGAGETRLTVNKPLMAAPALPRFLRSGDTASVGVVVHNNTPNAGTAVITAKANGATLASTKQTVAIAANSEARIRFAAHASDNAAASFEFAVAMNDEKDAVRVTVPIGRPRVIDNRLIVEKTLAAGETWTGAIGAGNDVLRNESQVTVSVDRSGVAELAPSLRALVEYPYGCLEQTMSRFIPLVAARDLANTLDDPSLKGTQASRFIAAGTAKVIRHQQGDGMFSLWPQSQTYPHLTAYALWGLTVAEKSGESVPKDVFDRGIAAMKNWSSNHVLAPNGEGATIAMTAYVMALRGQPDASLNARLYSVREGLPRWGQAFLLRALYLSKADPAQIAEMEKVIAANVRVTNGAGTVHESFAGEEYEMYMTSDVRATAMTLAALLEVDPKSELIAPLVVGLKQARQSDGGWHSTQENLWSIVALADYGRRSSTGSTTATVTVGGKQVLKQKISGAQMSSVHVALDKLSGDDIAVTTDNGAAVSVRVTEARLDAGKAQANGFTIARRYSDDKGTELTSVKAGQIVTVTLDITADDNRRWIALVDPIPAGFEVMNAKLASGGTDMSNQPPPPQATRWDRWRQALTWDYQEMRDDRVLWFSDQMAKGTYTLTYQARATIDGTFTVAPASIEMMYHPEVRARTAQTVFTVTK
ncbi:MAG TPA: MG2 domain-containing protein [Kofleriaceae bacterium]